MHYFEVTFLFIVLCCQWCLASKHDNYPYGNPWFYSNATKTSHFARSNRTKEEAEALWEQTLQKPFSMDEFVKILHDYTHCGMYTSEESKSDIINIAIGRTGSGTLKQAFLMNKLPGHHTTYCTALDAQRAGYKAVVVTIRDPVARILSGYQRREDGNPDSNKIENRMFQREFCGEGTDVNFYLDALRDRDHRKHRTALELTYGPTRQSYMIPLSQHYALTDPRLRIRVYYLCTQHLSDDFEELGKMLNWTRPSAARDFYLAEQQNPKKKGGKLRRLGSISGTRSEVKAQEVSPVNVRWIHEEVYKQDYELYIRHCGPHRGKVNYHDGPALV